MNKCLVIILLFASLVIIANGSLAEDALPQEREGVRGVGVTSLFTSATIHPNINLPDGNPAFTCFDIPVAVDPAARIVDVEVTVHHNHTWVGDLIYQIWNPDGGHVTMMHRPGRSGAGFGDSSNLSSAAPITFGNAYTDDAETMGNTLDTTGVICADDGRCHYFPNPDEDATSLPSFAGMAGSAAAGTWQFCASDNGLGDTGLLNTVRLRVVFDMPTTSACTSGAWQPVASVNIGRSRTGLAYSPVTGNFYLLGGEAEGSNRDIPIEQYDPAAGDWTEKSHLNTGVSNTGAAAVGSYIYVPGGFDGTISLDLMQRYNPATDMVMLMTPMPGVNSAHAVTALDGKVYVLGGSSDGIAGVTNYIYDVAANDWSTGAPLPTAVQYPAAATDGVYLYVIGGNTSNLTTVQRYDPVANDWDTLPGLNQGRGGPAAFFDGKNVRVVGGGWSSYLASTEYWDGVTWQKGAAMNNGARTSGAAYGDGVAVKAAGWNGTYFAGAEKLQVDCGQPEIALNPGAFSLTVGHGLTVARTLTISNNGQSNLTWTTTEAPPARLFPLPGLAEVAISTGESQPGDTLTSFVEHGLPLPESAPPALLDAPTGSAGSGLTFYADRNAFEADNPGLPVEDFEEGNVAANSIRTCPGPFDVHTNNDCFSAGGLLPGVLFMDDPGGSVDGLAILGAGFNNNASISLASNTLAEALHIYFTAPDVNAAGMDLQSHFAAGLVDITVYGWDGTTVLGTTVAAATNAGVFWGVTADQPIGRITIHSPTDQAEGVDDLTFGYAGPCAAPDDLPWLSVSATNGSTAPGDSDSIQLTFDTSGLTIGITYTGTLCVNSNDPQKPRVAVPLALTVGTDSLFSDRFEE